MDTPNETQEMGPESEQALEPSEELETAAIGSDLTAGDTDPEMDREAGADEGDDIVADDPRRGRTGRRDPGGRGRHRRARAR